MATHGGEDKQNDSAPPPVKSPAFLPPRRKIMCPKGLFVAQLVVRIFAVVCSVAAISVLLTAHQTFSLYGINFTARYSYSSSLRFLLGVDITLSIFSSLSSIFLPPSTKNPKYSFFFFFHDIVMTVVMMSGCAAATAVGYIGRYGEEKMGWAASCQYASKFCDGAAVSLVLSYLVFFCFFMLTVMSAHNLVISV